ncbi:MAG TPA: hypothetical protein VFV66_33870 [Nonomuraea sp.]|nr:hypothetical protein [Nonomuraea sp.]
MRATSRCAIGMLQGEAEAEGEAGHGVAGAPALLGDTASRKISSSRDRPKAMRKIMLGVRTSLSHPHEKGTAAGCRGVEPGRTQEDDRAVNQAIAARGAVHTEAYRLCRRTR